MEALVGRIHRLPSLCHFSDALLLHLLANSDTVPDRIASGVILFERGDAVTYWYLLLSGEVEFYLPASSPHSKAGDLLLRTVRSAALFGELNLHRHSCSARIRKAAEFIRIAQSHFLPIYNKHADHLQPFITIMDDLSVPPAVSQQPNGISQKPNGNQIEERRNRGNEYKFEEMRRELPMASPSTSRLSNIPISVPPLSNGPIDFPIIEPVEWTPPANLFEFSNSIPIERRIQEAGLILKRTMQLRSPTMLRDRHIQRGTETETFPNAMSGSEMTAFLGQLADEHLGTNRSFSSLQLMGMWQTLLDNHIIGHVTHEQQFRDKQILYKWTVEDPFEEYYEYRSRHPNSHFIAQSQLVEHMETPPIGAELPTAVDLQNALFFLSTIAPDSLFRIILSKPSSERTPEEMELVYEELLHVKALSHLSTMVKRELAAVVRFEQHQNAGTVLFHQGEPGKSWYIILRGSVDVSVIGKGVVCTLHEGDDFGKLALVNDAPRAATIALSEENSQFLRVDKHDFNRILRDVEANTVRLKEHGQDVLVLERIGLGYGEATTAKVQCCYSVMAGLPEKMIEYVLETRIDAQNDETHLDTFLEDFILTHIIYMPSNVLCNYLKNYYDKRGDMSGNPIDLSDPELSMHERIVAKRRVVTFVALWECILGIHFFLDSVANSFAEEIFCCVLEDSKLLPHMGSTLERISEVRLTRERVMRVLSRHPTTVLDGGLYGADAPAPKPILPSDCCKQYIHFSDSTFITIPIRLDKTASEICNLSCSQLEMNMDEQSFLIEVKSSGERVVYSPSEVSVPTMLSLNGRLCVVFKDEIDTLMPLPDQMGPTEPFYNSILDILSSSELATQLLNFHTVLFEATDEIELLFQVIGRNKFIGRSPSNLDILLRRFNEVQFWATTEVLLAPNIQKRVTILKKFIKIALHAKENKDLMSLFAITLGLSNVSVSRLSHLWEKVPSKLRRQFAEFEALLDPSRNHRAYRMLIAKMQPPVVPFVPLLLKDLTFLHEGNKTYFGPLVNFEKMHMIGNVLRSFRSCKRKYTNSPYLKNSSDNYRLISNFRTIDDQRRLMEISYQIEPPAKARHL